MLPSQDEVNKRIGVRLKELRVRRGLTQNELLDRMNSRESTAGSPGNVSIFSRYEKGETTISLRRLFILAGILEVDIHYFLEPYFARDTSFMNILLGHPDFQKSMGELSSSGLDSRASVDLFLHVMQGLIQFGRKSKDGS